MRKRLYILIPLFVAIVLLLLAVDFFVLTSDAQVESQLREFFRKELDSEVEFGEISRSFFSTRIDVSDIKLYPANDRSRWYLAAEKLEIRLDLLSAFEEIPVKKIKFVKPHVRLERDRHRKWNFPLADPDSGPFRSLVANTPTPEIEMDDATIEVRGGHRKGDVRFEGLNFTLKGNGGDEGHALTLAYYYGDMSNDHHLQLTFAMPANGDGMTISATGTGKNYLCLDESIRKLLRHLGGAGIAFAHEAHQIWGHYGIDGVIRIDSLVIQEHPDAKEAANQWQVDADLFLNDCSVKIDSKKQEIGVIPVEHISGQVLVHDGTVEFDLDARALGNYLEQIKGTVAIPQQSSAASRILIVVSDPEFDDDKMRNLFPSENAQFLDGIEIDNGVSLVLNITLDTETDEGEDEGEVKIKVEPGLKFDNGSMFLKKMFPYHMEKMYGELWIKDNKIVIPENGLTLYHGGGKITVGGTADITDPNIPQLDLTLRGENVPLDDELYAVLPATTQVVLDRYIDKRPVEGGAKGKWLAGYGDVECTLKTTEDGLIDPDMTIDVKHGTAKLEVFPYPLEEVTGRIRVTEPDANRVTLEKVTARQGTGVFTVTNGVATIDTADVTVIATKVPVDDKLGAVLEGSYRKSYDMLHLEGTVDVEVHVTQSKGQVEPDVEATVESRETLSLTYADFPLPITAISTRFVVKGNELVIEKFSGKVGGATLAAEEENHGRITFGETTEVFFHIAGIEGIKLTRENIAALPPDTVKAVENLEIEGTLDIKDLDITYYIVGEKEETRSYTLSMQTLCKDVAVGKNVKNISGTVDLKIFKKSNDDKISIRGNSPKRNFTFKVFGLTVKDLNMDIIPPETDEDKALNRHMIGFAGRFYGAANKSSFVGSFRVPIGFEAEHSGHLLIYGADLKSILIDLDKERCRKEKEEGKTPTPTPVNQHATGVVSMVIESFDYQKSDIKTLKGSGWIRITKADLGRRPGALWFKEFLQGKVNANGVINRGKVQFTIDSPSINFDSIILKSDALTIVGFGKADFKGNLDVNLFSETLLKVPFIGSIMNALNRIIYAVRITGTFAEPKPQAFSLINRLEDLPSNIYDMIKDMPNLSIGSEED